MNRIINALRTFLCMCALMLSGCLGLDTTYVFQLKETPKMLSEELAREKAREAMSKAGFDLKQWDLRKGTAFEQFGQTNWGRFHFTDGRHSRCVQVRLEGDRLICEVVQLP